MGEMPSGRKSSLADGRRSLPGIDEVDSDFIVGSGKVGGATAWILAAGKWGELIDGKELTRLTP